MESITVINLVILLIRHNDYEIILVVCQFQMSYHFKYSLEETSV